MADRNVFVLQLYFQITAMSTDIKYIFFFKTPIFFAIQYMVCFLSSHTLLSARLVSFLFTF